MIGFVGVIRTTPHELGYMLHHEYWGQGFASEAVALFLPLYWGLRPDVNFIIARVDTGNEASVRIVKRGGFVLGEVKEREFELVGKGWRDLGIWRLERPGWVEGSGSRDER